MTRDEFKGKLENIGYNHKELFKPFMDARFQESGYKSIIDFEYNPLRFKYHKNRSMELFVIVQSADGDQVLCILKYVHIFKIIYYRLEGFPISVNAVKENEVKVVQKLMEKKFIDCIIYDDEDKEIIEGRLGLKQYRIWGLNYYCHLDERWNKIDKGKWRSKNGVNKVRKNSDFVFREIKNLDAKNMKEMWKFWVQDMGERESVFYKQMYTSVFNSFGKMSLFKEKDLLIGHCVYYKDLLLAMSMYMRWDNGKIYQFVNFNFAKLKYDRDIYAGMSKEDIDILEYERKHVGMQIFYYSLKQLRENSIGKVLYVGDCDYNSKLSEYKKSITPEVIYLRQTEFFNK